MKKDPPLQKPADESFVRHLEEVTLFLDIKDQPGALTSLSKKMRMQKYLPGESIIKEGETGSELFLLLNGTASVFKSTTEGEQYKVAILDASNHVFFGEGGLLDTDARSATILAETVCLCLILDRVAIDEFGKEHPEWALPILLRIARVVMERLRKTNNDLMLLYNALVSEIRGD